MNPTATSLIAELAPEIKAAAARVSAAHLRFIEYAYGDSRCLDRAHFGALAEAHCSILAAVQPWPTLVQGPTLAEMERISVGICRLIKKIPEYFFDFDAEAMSDYYHLHLDFIKHFVLNAAGRQVIEGAFGRGDFIMSLDRLWCVEFNMATNLGGIWEPMFWQRQMTAVPAIADFLRQAGLSARVRNTLRLMMRHIVKHAMRHIPGLSGEINVAYVVDNEALDHDEELEPLRQHLGAEYQIALRELAPGAAGTFFICGYPDLHVQDGLVFHSAAPVHILLEVTSGDVPTHLLRCLPRGRMTLHSGPVTYVLCNKLNLAILSEFRDCGLFNEEERELIGDHVPWTRKVMAGPAEYEGATVDLPAFILENRERLVLKKSISSSGHDVFIGPRTGPEEWKAALATAFEQKDWIVQQYVPSPPYLYQDGDVGCSPHDVIWGLFVIDDQYAGAFLRVLPKLGGAVVNRSRGSLDAIVLEVADGPVDGSYVTFPSEEALISREKNP